MMNNHGAFVLAVLFHFVACMAFLAGGIFLLINNHPVAGGWVIAGAVANLFFTNIRMKGKDDKKEPDDDET